MSGSEIYACKRSYHSPLRCMHPIHSHARAPLRCMPLATIHNPPYNLSASFPIPYTVLQSIDYHLLSSIGTPLRSDVK